MDKDHRISRLKAKCGAAKKRNAMDDMVQVPAGSSKRPRVHQAKEVSSQHDDQPDEEDMNLDASFIDTVCHDETEQPSAAKSTGTSNATLNKFLKEIALIADGKRRRAEPKKHRKFPKKRKKDDKQQVVYICPYQRPVRKKRNEQWETELCGYTLREVGDGNYKSYHCDLCETVWTRKAVEKDGNLFIMNPVRRAIQETMDKYGCQIDPSDQERHDDLRDVTDGMRSEQMGIPSDAIELAIHADSGEFSKSTNKKMYLVFVQVLNLPVRIRKCVWHLAAVWVGENLPSDRESFLLNLTTHLRDLDENSESFQPVVWTDKFGTVHHSSAYVKNPPMKNHDDFVEMEAEWDDLSPKQRHTMLKMKLTKGFRRPSLIIRWPKIDMVDAFAIDVMHMMDEGVARWFLSRTVEGRGRMRLTAAKIKEIDRR
ncbi:hypothetical protein RvY_10323 [Ramazzottius varieornatus]|uniref:Uncharacterized protein n=1 Tax=Ramazzottius varieornatus TaxID=947166 RepID=A0A1D1VLE0_RAMVA|nr:hypothetical protein RvY_10323 [Ramazzottius varieornatus]